jgi:hypothetical protein
VHTSSEGSESSRQIGWIGRGMTYLGGAPVAVVAPDGLSVAAAVEGASVIPSLSGHDGRRGGKRRTIAREKGKRRNRPAPNEDLSLKPAFCLSFHVQFSIQ